MSYSVTLHLILWTEGLLMKLELEQRPESPSDPPSTLSPPQCGATGAVETTVHSFSYFKHGYYNLNPGTQAYTESTWIY